MFRFIKLPLLNINLYLNLRNLTILLIYVSLFLQNKFNLARTVTMWKDIV